MMRHDLGHSKSLKPNRPEIGVGLYEISQQLERQVVTSDSCLAEIQVLDSVVIAEGSQNLLDCLAANVWVAADV